MRHDFLITPRIYDAVVVLGFDKKNLMSIFSQVFINFRLILDLILLCRNVR